MFNPSWFRSKSNSRSELVKNTQNTQKDEQCTYKVTLRRVRVTIVVEEKQ